MTTDCIANGHGAMKLRIESMQSVVPTKPTEPRQSRRVSVPGNHHGGGGFRRRFHMILCYNRTTADVTGWRVAGWIKESLGEALVDKPVFAGRLRKGENGNFSHHDHHMEIVSNDGGVRLVEAEININLADFLDLSKHKKSVESDLVFWKDVHESTPQYSPLFYIQVTNFKCGGYSIGISCSLFLADPFGMTSFLKKWSKIHTTMLSQTDETNKIPTFYLPNMKTFGSLPIYPLDSPTHNNNHSPTKTVIFKIPSKILNSDHQIYKTIAAKCIQEAENKNSKSLSSRFTMFLKDSSEDVKVEICSKDDVFEEPFSGGFDSMGWEDFGGDGICFNEDNKAVHFSCWINTITDEDFVMIVPSSADEGHNAIVTISD